MKFDLETVVIAVSFITSFFAVFLSNGIIIGVPAIAQEFAMNNVIQNWVPTIFFLVVAVFTVPAGQISGKFGVKKSLLGGVLLYLFASAFIFNRIILDFPYASRCRCSILECVRYGNGGSSC